MTDFFGFHPIIVDWFRSRFTEPTEPQRLGWPSIAAGEHTLIAAPTGSGKTLAAFLACIDRLLKQALEGPLEDEIKVVYVSPLRALSNDMHRNLEVPLAEIMALAAGEGEAVPPIRVGLRTGDTSSSQRAALVRRPPHILVTTPESLYLLLTAQKSREKLRTVETVIVDEIHALVRDKRGSHLSLSLERLEALREKPLQRIGLSATQKPIERMAEFLVSIRKLSEASGGRKSPGPMVAVSPNHRGTDAPRSPSCRIIDVGHERQLDLAIETPPSELGAVCMHEQWDEINARLVELIREHRSTLVFVNTRRLAERVTHQLTELLGEDEVSSHHGSLSARMRLETERRLKSGELKAVVATASLELGIDIGYIDLVIQIGSPRSLATFLQRIGRSGHSLGLVPKGRLFALTRDELLECMALIRGVRAGRLDAVPIPQAPLDVLAQQIVAEVSADEWSTDELFALFCKAYPYRQLSRRDFDRTVEFLSEGITRLGRRGRVYLHHDQVGKRLRARRGARIAAATNAGTIPDIASFRVVAEPEHTVVGSLDEDFAIESMRGDVFLLGNTSWRILHVRGGEVAVADAHGAPPTIPFWRGEAPGRTFELSEEVSRLREDIASRFSGGGAPPLGWSPRAPAGDRPLIGKPENDNDNQTQVETVQWLVRETGCSYSAAEQAVHYIAAQKAAIGLVPTQQRIVFERFFDETGGMQLVVHAPFGSAVNRAWGLALRKRFCRTFDFELQASADNDGFVLSLGPQHSFPIESLFSMVNERNIRLLVEQAVLAVPTFELRWRWNVTRALQVLRMRNGKKVPPALQRFRADDLLSAVFPQLAGCQENHAEPNVEIPDHPLVNQTMDDCLHEALDIDGLLDVLRRIDSGDIELIARDTREPSPFCYELLNANVYAFLDGGEIQERRARAVSLRRSLSIESLSDLGRLDPEAIERVRREAQPLVCSADELHDVLLSRIVLPVDETSDWHAWYQELAAQGRATTVSLPEGRRVWVAAERLPAALAVFPAAVADPPLTVPDGVRADWASTAARVELVRGWIEVCGPVTAAQTAQRLGITVDQASAALEALEGEGVVLRGRFTPHSHQAGLPFSDASAHNPHATDSPHPSSLEWCHRALLARIHRLTMEGLRRQIEPVGVDVYLRHLFRHHGLLPGERRSGPSGLFEVVGMLQGIDVPAACWERDLLPARLEAYRPEWLDELCLTGEVGWGRLFPPKPSEGRSRPMAGITRVAPISLFLRNDLHWLTVFNVSVPDDQSVRDALSSPAQEVQDLLRQRGALFAADLLKETRMLSAQLDEALGELVSRGLLTADGFAGLRQLIAPKTSPSRRRNRSRSRLLRRRRNTAGTGRWSLWRTGWLGSERSGAPSVLPWGLTSFDPSHPAVTNRVDVEEWAWQLLRRWGVVFRDLLLREGGAPSWFELVQVYRRLEARGEIRGGRFVTGVAGEQFALGETVKQLRKLRDQSPRNELVTLSAADPLNLVGILTDHARIPSTATNFVAYLNGQPAAALQAGEVVWFEKVPEPLRGDVLKRFGVSPANRDGDNTDAAPPDDGRDEESSRRQHRDPRPPRYPSGIPRPRIS